MYNENEAQTNSQKTNKQCKPERVIRKTNSSEEKTLTVQLNRVDSNFQPAHTVIYINCKGSDPDQVTENK